jgi:hypothetical protein
VDFDTPTELVLQWARDVLLDEEDITDIVGTRIYPEIAPSQAAYPLIILTGTFSSDLNWLTARVWTEVRFDAKAVVKPGFRSLVVSLGSQMSKLLTDQDVSVPGGRIRCLRQAEILPYPDEAQYLNYGHSYRVLVTRD